MALTSIVIFLKLVTLGLALAEGIAMQHQCVCNFCLSDFLSSRYHPDTIGQGKPRPYIEGKQGIIKNGIVKKRGVIKKFFCVFCFSDFLSPHLSVFFLVFLSILDYNIYICIINLTNLII